MCVAHRPKGADNVLLRSDSRGKRVLSEAPRDHVLSSAAVNGSSCCPTCGRPIIDKQTLAMVLADVSVKHDILPSQITGRSRERHLVLARDEIVYRARMEGYSYESIGVFLNRDHTTIIAAERRHRRRVGA